MSVWQLLVYDSDIVYVFLAVAYLKPTCRWKEEAER